MHQIHRSTFLAGAALSASLVTTPDIALAAPKTYVLPEELVELRAGPQPGFDAAKNNCTSCHSADYINYQPGKKGQIFWESAVQKMLKVYHAPIDEENAKAIVEYLVKTY